MIMARKPAEIKEWMQVGAMMLPSFVPLSKGQQGLITGTLNRYLNGDDNRYLVLGWLFNDKHNNVPIRSADLSDDDWLGLWNWLDPMKEESQWAFSPTFPLEAALVLTEALRSAQNRILELPPVEREIDVLRAAVTQIGGVVTAVLNDEGEPDIAEGIEVRAEADEPTYQPLKFLDRIQGKGYYLPKH